MAVPRLTRAHPDSQRRFEVRIYTLDHLPPHRHVAKAGAVVKVDLATCQVVEIVGTISNRDVKRAELPVAKYAKFLKDEWTKIHGKQTTDRNRS